MGLPVDECVNNCCATALCRPEAEADNRVVAEDGYFNGTTGLPVGLHFTLDSDVKIWKFHFKESTLRLHNCKIYIFFLWPNCKPF
jgi:hypothetical protein